MATAYVKGLDGDVRVRDNTITVTYYNFPDTEGVRGRYENLSAKLRAEKVDPRVPLLVYGPGDKVTP